MFALTHPTRGAILIGFYGWRLPGAPHIAMQNEHYSKPSGKGRRELCRLSDVEREPDRIFPNPPTFDWARLETQAPDCRVFISGGAKLVLGWLWPSYFSLTASDANVQANRRTSSSK
jgi:hypothetical protein